MSALRDEVTRYKQMYDTASKKAQDAGQDYSQQIREAQEKASRVSLLQRENEDLKKEAAEETAKYHRLMQGIVQEQEQRVRLETTLEQERARHRHELEGRGDEMQDEFDKQVEELKRMQVIFLLTASTIRFRLYNLLFWVSRSGSQTFNISTRAC